MGVFDPDGQLVVNGPYTIRLPQNKGEIVRKQFVREGVAVGLSVLAASILVCTAQAGGSARPWSSTPEQHGQRARHHTDDDQDRDPDAT